MANANSNSPHRGTRYCNPPAAPGKDALTKTESVPKCPPFVFSFQLSDLHRFAGNPGGAIAMILKLCVAGFLSTLLLDQGAQPQTATKADQPTATQATPQSSAAADSKAQGVTKSADESKDNLIEVEKQIVEQTNAQRARYGLPPLAVDRSLIQTARSHAAWMTNNRTLQHTTRPVGENIAMGQRSTDEAVGAWMASPGHRANILNNSYKRIGVAAYRTPDGTVYWCQQFLP